MKKEKTIIEYPEAPSGSVYFYNYKEPLMPFISGYGYHGAVIFDVEDGKIQCHYCGTWHKMLWHHLKREHNTTVAHYRADVGLNMGTALVAESTRAKMIEGGLRNRGPEMQRRWEKRKPITKAELKKRSKNLKGGSAEQRNNANTCPEQLLARLQKKCEELGRVPTAKEFKLYETLKRVYGSTAAALDIIGRTPRKAGLSLKGTAYSRQDLIESLLRFKSINGRAPAASDTRRKLLPNVYHFQKEFGSWNKALKAAGV